MQPSYNLIIDRRSAGGAERQTHYYVVMIAGAEEELKGVALRHLAGLYPGDELAVLSCRMGRPPCGLSRPFTRRMA